MAEHDDAGEKTEQPSAKRLKEAREKGQVARSKDFNALIILVFTGVAFLTLGESSTRQLTDMMHQAFIFDSDKLILPELMIERLGDLAWFGVKSVLPILIVILLVSIAAPLLLGGWVFSTQSLAPQFSRLSPMKGFKRMLSFKGVFEMIKAFLKFLVVGIVALVLIKHELPRLVDLSALPLTTALSAGLMVIMRAFLMISGSIIFIAAIDVPFQLYEHNKQLKMTKQEVKEEYKEVEGKPEVKAQIRRAQQEIAKRRMMNEVPKAAVVITNPTHYAVAIAYQQTGKRAPIVVAKGRDIMAMQINKVAKAHDIPMISVPPLARAIYYSTKINHEIPRGLYIAVAQVLAYIFQLKDKKSYDRAPILLQDVPIPEELKRDAEETTE